jgi:hypothetical protein
VNDRGGAPKSAAKVSRGAARLGDRIHLDLVAPAQVDAFIDGVVALEPDAVLLSGTSPVRPGSTPISSASRHA